MGLGLGLGLGLELTSLALLVLRPSGLDLNYTIGVPGLPADCGI